MLFLVVPVDHGVEHTHATFLKLEVVDCDGAFGCRVAEQSHYVSAPAGLSAELYGVEIDKVEHIANVDAAQVDGQ